jgi:sugar phosphate isomerase/epimerase
MILTGIADEASHDIDGQIRAHQELGWDAIELRVVDGDNVAGVLGDQAFEAVAARLEAAGMHVTGFASAIGNWSRPISGDFQVDVDDLIKSVPRMQRLGAQVIRTMGWVGDGVSDTHWRDEGIRRYRELVKIAADGGIRLAMENCTGWAGESARQMQQFLEAVDSEHLVMLYDIGNVIGHGDDWQEYYAAMKPFIRYIHVKDCRRNPAGGPSESYAYAGEGDAHVYDVLLDQFRSGYDGVISIEPHVAKIIHDASLEPDPQQMYDSYLRYGRKFIDIATRARQTADA